MASFFSPTLNFHYQPPIFQAWPFKVRDRAPAPPHAPKRF